MSDTASSSRNPFTSEDSADILDAIPPICLSSSDSIVLIRSRMSSCFLDCESCRFCILLRVPCRFSTVFSRTATRIFRVWLSLHCQPIAPKRAVTRNGQMSVMISFISCCVLKICCYCEITSFFLIGQGHYPSSASVTVKSTCGICCFTRS